MRFFISSVILETDVELASSAWTVKDEPTQAGNNVGDKLNPEVIVILDTTVMQRLDAKTRFTRNNEVIHINVQWSLKAKKAVS